MDLTVAQYMWILPIVGITVVMLGLLILALILGQFDWLQNDSKKEPSRDNTVSNGVETKQVDNKDFVQSPNDEEVNAAIATALYLFMQETTDKVVLTEEEAEYNFSPWTSFYRGVQNRRAEKWQQVKRWS